MPTPILVTKLYIPPLRPKVVLRPRLIERLNAGLHRKLTLISAAAGFGKTTLVSEWIAQSGRPAAWLSLDEGDGDPIGFLTYLVAALQTIAPNIGEGVLGALQSPQPPPVDSLLTTLLNEIIIIPGNFILVLDDYHVIDAKPVDQVLSFLLDHLPPQMHLVIATREDPMLPLARLRVRDQLTELRVIDLRFNHAEAADFLNQAMGLALSAEAIAALETRTEGWIAGLQLAAISMQGQQDTAEFIKSFTGSHHFVLDYLLEEVLHQQPEPIQTFLLHTSILDRLCGSLCDAVLQESSAFSQATLEYLQHANLFIVPLDNERRWYRYHHLFADLLRQRLASGYKGVSSADLHRRASDWFEANELDIEAFHHAAAAHDVDHAARLVEGEGMPLPFRGAAVPVLKWLATLPLADLDARPSLWVIYATSLLFVSQLGGVEDKLQKAETALQNAELDEPTRDLIGHIASIRATIAVSQNQVEEIVYQSRRALDYLHPNNLPVRTAVNWSLGYAYQIQGNRTAANQAYRESIAISEAIGHFIINIMASIGLGNLQEYDNQFDLAAQTYRHVLQLMGDPPMPVACEVLLGLARMYYERNDLDAAAQYSQQSSYLAKQIENTDRAAAYELFLARLKLAQGDVTGAASTLAKADQVVRQRNFIRLMPPVVSMQVLMLLRQGEMESAAELAQAHELPMSQARVALAQGNPSAALAILKPFRQQTEAKGWANERLKVMVLQSIAHYQQGEKESAVRILGEVLALAEPSGFIRTFLDEGQPMARLLTETVTRGIMPNYAQKLLTAFDRDPSSPNTQNSSPAQSLIEPLSEREMEILRLIAQGLSNQEISDKLFLALSTVKGHNRNIFDKLQVQRRTEAVARARELGLS